MTVSAGTLIGMPALTAAWRAGIWPAPAYRTWPMITYCTWSPPIPCTVEGGLDREAAEVGCGEGLQEPSSRPMGVRAPATITEPVVPEDMRCDHPFQLRRAEE